MSEIWLLTFLLAAITLGTRVLGVAVGQRLPQTGPWAKGLNALPGCLIVSLVAVMLVGGAWDEWMGALVALLVAVLTRSLPLTMMTGIIVVWALRQ